MARTAVKLGQVLRLERKPTGLRLRADYDCPISCWIETPVVRVRKISFLRKGLATNVVWLEIEAVNDPLNFGWIPFNCGEHGNRHVKIDRLVFEEPEQASVKTNISCSGA